MRSDRRNSYRFEIAHGLARLRVPARQWTLGLHDLSGSGGALIVPEEASEEIASAPLLLQLGQYPPFLARVVPARPGQEASGRRRVGVYFEKLDRLALASLSPFLVDRYLESRFHDPRLVTPSTAAPADDAAKERARRLIRYHTIKRGALLRIYEGELFLPIQLRARELICDNGVELVAAEIAAGSAELLAEERAYTFVFPGANAINFFVAVVRQATAERVLFERPPTVMQTGFRNSKRTKLDPARQIWLHMQHPRLRSLELLKPVLDVGARGLAFPLNPREDLLCPGDRVDQVTIDVGGVKVRAEAMVRSINVQEAASGELCCGLELVNFDLPDDAELWRDFVFACNHPTLRLGRESEIFEAWTVLESSGYVALTTPALRAKVKRHYFSAWCRHARDARLSRCVMLYRQERAVGTMAASLLYPATWMVHHTGIDETARRSGKLALFSLAQELYEGMVYVLYHLAPLRYFMVTFGAGKPWNELMYCRFLRAHPRSEAFYCDRHRLYKCVLRNVSDSSAAPQPDSVAVPADRPLRHLVAEGLRRLHGPLEIDALSYDEAELDLRAFSESCAARGYERGRHVLVALVAGEPCAALLAETADPGVNVFGLANSCSIVPLSDNPASLAVARQTLLRAAVSFYRAQDRDEFVLLERAGSMDPPAEEAPDVMVEGSGFRYQEDVLRWIASKDVLPAYLNYVNEVIGLFRG